MNKRSRFGWLAILTAFAFWAATPTNAQVTSVGSGNCLTGGPITSTGTLAVNPNCLTIVMTQYSAGGTANDTVGVQAAFSACAASGCILTCPTGVTYSVDPITVGSNTIVQGCTFHQRASGNHVLNLSGVSNVQINSSQFVGNTAISGVPAPISGDSPIWITDSSRVWVRDNYFTAFGLYDTFSKNSSYIFVLSNFSYGVAFGPRFLCSRYIHITGNTYRQTSLISATPTASQFAIGPMLDSDACGYNMYAEISGNLVKDFPYSQAYEVHSGQFVTIANNIADNVSTCISANTFNSNDAIDHLAIVGNSCQANVGTPLPTSSNGGINVAGGPGLPTPYVVTISGNAVHAFGRAYPDINVGCINLDSTKAVTVTGNTVQGCGANGIVLQRVELSAAITGNTFDNIVLTASNQNGVKIVNNGSNAIISGNMFYGMNTNVNNVGGSSTVKFTGLNNCVSVTTCY